MGFWSELGKIAIDVAAEVLQESNSSNIQQEDMLIENDIINQEKYADSEDEYCMTDEEYAELRDEITKRSFQNILLMKYDEEIDDNSRQVASDIINERMEYIHNVTRKNFSGMNDDELYDYYLQGLEKGEFNFGFYSRIIDEVVYSEINERISLKAQYGLTLIDYIGEAPLKKIYLIQNQPFVDDCMKLNIEATLNARKEFVASVLNNEFNIDKNFIKQFAIARDLQEDYYCVPYKFIYNNCYKEIVKEENADLLNELLDLVFESNAKKLVEGNPIYKDIFNQLLAEKLQNM